MPETPSAMLDLGTTLPSFSLPDFNGHIVSDAYFGGSKAVLVAFICKHCPFVRHIRQEFSRFAKEYQAKGLGIVAIASNDTTEFPEDGPDGMKEEAAEAGYTFPYLFDEKQRVAKAFRAACTPDLFLFDDNRRLAYRGQFDGSRPKNDVPVNGADLRAAADAVLAGKPAPAVQKPSIGCNIKWSPGNAPEYFKT
ncbi:MAG: thioredoxin family protein [Vicinamibacterales bacterium]